MSPALSANYTPPVTRLRGSNQSAAVPSNLRQTRSAPARSGLRNKAKSVQESQIQPQQTAAAPGGQYEKKRSPTERAPNKARSLKATVKPLRKPSKAQNRDKKRTIKTGKIEQPDRVSKNPRSTKKAVTKASSVSAWVEEVSATRSTRAPQRQPSETLEVASASTQTTPTLPESTSPMATEKTDKSEKSRDSRSLVTPARLQNHGVELKIRKKDPSLNNLHDKVNTLMQTESDCDMSDVLSQLKAAILQAFQKTDQWTYSILDTLLEELDLTKSRIRYPFAQSKYFANQLEKCSSRNEGVLQRTVMMSIFHPTLLPSKFEWNAEGQWFVDPYAGEFRQVKDGKDQKNLPRPKPDLMFAFSREEFIPDRSWKNIPTDLEKAMSPDGYERVFPFLFVEVKGNGEKLDKAHLSNLNNASQALNNIGRWFERAAEIEAGGKGSPELPASVEKWNACFHEVRIFSFAFNAHELVVRVHRAEVEHDDVFFCTSEFHRSKPYTRDNLCNLFNNVLLEYAGRELFDSLTKVYKVVTQTRFLQETDNHGPRAGRAIRSSDRAAQRSNKVTDAPNRTEESSHTSSREDGGEEDSDDDNDDDDLQELQFSGQFSQGPRLSPIEEETEAFLARRSSSLKRKSPDSESNAPEAKRGQGKGKNKRGAKGRKAVK